MSRRPPVEFITVPDQPDPRVFFAAERTLLAWLRTGLAVIGVGFLVARFGLFLRMLRQPGMDLSPPVVSSFIGIGFVLLGAGMIALSVWQHEAFIRKLTFDQRPHSYNMRYAVWISALVSVLGMALAVYLLASVYTGQPIPGTPPPAGEAWLLENSQPTSQGPKVGALDPREVIRQVASMKGDAARGEQLYAKLQCNKCHTVDSDEPPRGPYLPQVAKASRRAQLAEAVVLPSQSLAPGFVTNIFQMEDGRVLSGYVTVEGPAEIVIRDNQGNEIKLNPDEIEGQRKDDISVMPVGLANEVTVDELADLITYLESLSTKADK